MKKIATRAANVVFDKRAPELKLRCQGGTTPSSASCMEAAPRPDTTRFLASETCAQAGRRLPSAAELWAFQQAGGDLAGNGQFGEGTVDIDHDTNIDTGVLWWTIRDDGMVFLRAAADLIPYRCVAEPTN